MTEETISIVTDTSFEEPAADTRSWEVPPADFVNRKVEVSVEKLEREMTHFLQVVGHLFSRAELESNIRPGMQLDEIELSIEIVRWSPASFRHTSQIWWATGSTFNFHQCLSWSENRIQLY